MALLQNKAVGILAAGFGLASESVTAYKARRRQRNDQDAEDDNAEQLQVAEAQHEQDWALDETQDELAHHEEPPNYAAATDDIDEMAESFIRDHPPSYSPAMAPNNETRLPYPVVIPQRRPKSRKRGFIKAYAPVLQDFGIDQAMFLDFLESSNRICHGRPWLNAINLASFATMALPSGISIAVSIAIQKITEAAIEMDGRQRTNSFFDRVNEEVFRPRGLYCMVMTYIPESSSPYARFDLSFTVTKSIDQGGSSNMLAKVQNRFKGSHGTTHGNIPYQEVAPLVFPELDELAEQRGDTRSKMKKMDFVADYMDRRSQMQFMMENPDSALSKSPKPTFTSRYADPSHPANSGSLIALVSGGHITEDHLPRSQLRRWRSAYGGRRQQGQRDLVGTTLAARSRRSPRQRVHEGLDPEGNQRQSVTEGGSSSRNPRERLLRGGPLNGVNKLLKNNVLYLMIVNLPSEEEMDEARELLRS